MKYLIALILCSILFSSCEENISSQPGFLSANAGNDQTIIAGSYAVFDPTKSVGFIDWYEWQQYENNPQKVAIFSQSRQNKPESNVDKVAFTKTGLYKFILIVRSGVTPGNLNGAAASIPDTLVITVNPNTDSKFEDANLEAIIRINLNKQVEELTNNVLTILDSLFSFPAPQRIASLNGLENCTNIVYLSMGLQDVSNITPLASLTKLRVLWLDQNRKISDITPLSELTELKELNINSNLITDTSPLNNLMNLENLDLSYNPINDLSGLKFLTKLKILRLSDGSINDLSLLSNLNSLQEIYIIKSNLEDISNLKDLTEIKTLELWLNKIHDISSLSDMKKLENIKLNENNISDITSLKNLSSLKYLDISNNQITDIKPLVDNPALGTHDMIVLYHNPLNEISIKEYIPALQARGVFVDW
jgi:hypothetical protein